MRSCEVAGAARHLLCAGAGAFKQPVVEVGPPVKDFAD